MCSLYNETNRNLCLKECTTSFSQPFHILCNIKFEKAEFKKKYKNKNIASQQSWSLSIAFSLLEKYMKRSNTLFTYFSNASEKVQQKIRIDLFITIRIWKYNSCAVAKRFVLFIIFSSALSHSCRLDAIRTRYILLMFSTICYTNSAFFTGLGFEICDKK